MCTVTSVNRGSERHLHFCLHFDDCDVLVAGDVTHDKNWPGKCATEVDVSWAASG